jgi:LuxR family maltose regulon positive regulatory protein
LQDIEYSAPLIRTKLNKPCLELGLIQRLRLLDRLNTGLQRKITLVSAPAGFGKTSQVCMWLEEFQCPIAWISLDKNDSDLGVFLGYLVAAIQNIFPDCCSETDSLLRASNLPPVEYIASTLINEIDALPVTSTSAVSKPRFVVVLDDYHQVGSQSVHQLMSKLIEYQPETMHLVIISRQDPASLPLAQLRGRRQMLEVRQADLRFDLTETRTFLKQALRVNLPEDTVSMLDQWIEGWPVGLRLASLSMRDMDDPTAFVENLKGSDHYVMDYLVDEVLSHQPENIQTFLLHTSILDRFCGPLADAVTGIDGPEMPGQTYLEWIGQANLFLVALDNQGEWYRYHHMFRDLLVGKLQSDVPIAKIRELHRQASQWFAEQGYVEEAIHHALKSNEITAAAELVERYSLNVLNRVETRSLERWLAMLPEETTNKRPKLLIARAWLSYLQWNLSSVELFLDKAEANLETSNASTRLPGEFRDLEGQINALRSAVVYVIHGDMEQTSAVAEQALQQLPLEARATRNTALIYWAFSQQSLGNSDVAIRRIQEIVNETSTDRRSTLQALLALATIYYLEAQLDSMFQISQQLMAFADRNPVFNAIGIANFTSGHLMYEWNDLEAASLHFSREIDLLYRTNFLGPFSCGLGQARIYQLHGELEKAQNLIDDLRTEAQRLNNFDVQLPLDAIQAYQWMLQGDHSKAVRWARSYHPGEIEETVFWFTAPSLTRVKIFVTEESESDVQAARSDLHEQLANSEARHFTPRVIQILVHLAMVNHKLGYTKEAHEALQRAITLAQPGGLIRSIVDCGPTMVPLLQNLERRAIDSHYLDQLIDAFDGIMTNLPLKTVGEKEPTLTKMLTHREEEVLRLFEVGLTNQEIADELVISVLTVKKHSTNIYHKLGVKNRREAVYIAKQLDLLPS